MSDTPPVSSSDKFEDSSRTEEVQAIIERMPTYWTKWVALFLSLLLAILFTISFLIQYPDTVDGQISITSNISPVRLVTNSNGRLILLKETGSTISSGDVIACVENGANYNHILFVDSLLNSLSSSVNKEFIPVELPDSLLLGDISSVYNSFVLSYMQYCRVITSDIYDNMSRSLEEQISSNNNVIHNIQEEIKLKRRISSNIKDMLSADSLLYSKEHISKQEYKQQEMNYLNHKEGLISLKSNLKIKQSELSRNKLELQRLRLEEIETKERLFSDLMTRKNELYNGIRQWKERYLISSPINGDLEYLGFWKDNVYVRAGNELFSVIPEKSPVFGEVIIPSFGAGKVKIGQSVNVKVNNFPYDEYGLIKGEVLSISRITNKVETSNGVGETYLVVVGFPNGTVTNFGKTLPLEFESKGTAEIITKRKRLIERLFDNLKSQGVK